MAEIKSVNCGGVQIPLSIPVEMELPKFLGDAELNHSTRQYLMLFNIIQEQLKVLMEKIDE